MWIREYDGRGKGAKNNVSELNATRWDGITKSEVIFTKELWEIVEKDEKKSQSAAIQISGSVLQVRFS
jgi:hypothetical protein